MSKIHSSMLMIAAEEITALNDAKVVLKNLRSSAGWNYQTITGQVDNPQDTIVITKELSDRLTTQERDIIIGVLADGQQRIVNKMMENLKTRYGVTVE